MVMHIQKIKPGYKQTEVGIFPEDWVVKKLREDCDLITKGTTPTSIGKDFTSNGINFIKIETLEESGKIIEDKVAFIDEETNNLLKRSQLRDKDILISIAGALGRVAVVTTDILPANTNQALAIIRLKASNKIYYRFLFYYLNSSTMKKHIEMINVQGAQANLSLENVGDFIIHLPPTREEQFSIAEALSNTDELIEQLDNLITKKKNIKQGAMQELLTGKNRLMGFSGKWNEKSLEEIGESLIGLTYKPSNVKPVGVLVLRASNVSDGKLRFDDNVFVEMDIPDKIMVQNGDILICVRNGSRNLIGKCGLVDEHCKGMTFGTFMTVFRTPFYNFVFHYFQSEPIKRQIREHLGATINQITNKSLKSFRILFPEDPNERDAIAQILSDMNSEIQELENERDKYIKIKNGMMQKLLTGEIRLK